MLCNLYNVKAETAWESLRRVVTVVAAGEVTLTVVYRQAEIFVLNLVEPLTNSLN